MATVPFPGDWIPDAQFTGNSDFVFDSNGVIWLVANSTASGVIIFSSADHGATFQQAATIPNVGSTGLSFDPAVTIDANNVLHLVGQIATASPFLVTLQKYSYDTVGNALTGPFSITTNGIVGSDYDIVALSNGHCYIVTSLMTGDTETVEGIEIDATGAVIATDTLVSQALAVGNRYGSISLISPDGIAVEIYLCSIPKVFNFADSTATISVISRATGDSVGTPTVLTTFLARYVSDRLTVIANGTVRYLVNAYYSQQKSLLIGNALLGYRGGTNAAWVFHGFTGTSLRSLVEPVLSVSPNGVVLAVINATLSQFASGATISLFDFDPTIFHISARTDFPYPGQANWLRGTKAIIPADMTWGILSQRAVDGVGRFYTGFSVPPVAELVPAVSTTERGIVYTFDASGSFDLNMHPLQFSWALTDPTGKATLTPDGDTATVELPLSAGPAAQTLTLTVSVVDVDANGDPLHSPSTASATLNYPLIPLPVIAAAAPLQAARNSQVTIDPTVTVSAFTTPSYLWEQTGGTTVNFLSLPFLENLLIQTNGAAVAGETLTFTLTVNDGVNVPVSQAFEIVVAARVATGETTHLARAARGGNISQRNSTEAWAAPTASSVLSGFRQAKRADVVLQVSSSPEFVQSGSYLLIGPASIVAERNGETWHVLTPVPTETILDAVHSFLDQTLVLTSGQKLLQFIPSTPAVDTDDATTVLLSNISNATYTTIDATPPFGGQRVAVLTSTEGVLLLQINDDFEVSGSLELTATSGLYGAANVQWVRMSDVENLHTGSMLVGTIDDNGDTFETEYSLTTRSVTQVFDSSSRKNQHVSTGELLFQSVDSYSGVPMPPVLTAPVVANPGVKLSWTQSRADLVTGYTVEVSTGGAFSPSINIGTSSITAVWVPLPPGVTYSLAVIAHSADGDSAPSNVVTIAL